MKNPRPTKPRLSKSRARNVPPKEKSRPDQGSDSEPTLLVEGDPDTEKADDAGPRQTFKVDAVIAMLRRPRGASMAELMVETGWQRHSVRGALSGAIKKRLGAPVCSQREDGERRYRASEV